MEMESSLVSMETGSSVVSMQRQSNLHEKKENPVESNLHGERIKSTFHEERNSPPCRQLLEDFSWSGLHGERILASLHGERI